MQVASYFMDVIMTSGLVAVKESVALQNFFVTCISYIKQFKYAISRVFNRPAALRSASANSATRIVWS